MIQDSINWRLIRSVDKRIPEVALFAESVM